MNFTRLGGRTFVMAMGCGVSTYLMRWFDKLDNGSTTAIVIASVCAYIAKAGWDQNAKKKESP